MTHSEPLSGVHSTAVIDEKAVLAPTSLIGPYSVIGPEVQIGEGVRVGPHVFIERDTKIGEEVRISKGAVLGTDPQDLKYGGERTFLEIGPRTRVREFATINRGTAASGITRVGADALIMSYAHIAHDCQIGDHVVLANSVNMGGHVEIGDWAIIGGLTPIHQFVRIGCHSMVGGASRIDRDVAPYTIAAGNPAFSFGINRIGLERRGFDPESIRQLRTAFRQIFRSEIPLRIALEQIDVEQEPEEVRRLVRFIRTSERGIIPSRSGIAVNTQPNVDLQGRPPPA